MDSSLKEFIIDKLDSSAHRLRHHNGLTIGLEQEFFLLQKSSKSPATHEESQNFLLEISKQPSWYIREKSFDVLGEMISRVSYEESNGRYTTIKYDHHPHLIEIAFSYHANLFELDKRVQSVFNTLKSVAEYLGLEISTQSILQISTSDARVTSPLADFEKLRHYRSLLFKNRGQDPNSEHVNYAAGIAATQTHIGNTHWWLAPNYVDSLYCLEPYILPLSKHLSKLEGAGEELFIKRWAGYQAVFQGFPLVGFPKMKNWTIDNWIHALINSPLSGNRSDLWAGKTLSEIKTMPFQSWQEFFACVRDMQIIRPRLYGTLEFRADPALQDPKNIICLTALRLGICSYLVKTYAMNDIFNFEKAQRKWWDNIAHKASQLPKPIIELALRGLKDRQLGEEKYLARLTTLSYKDCT